MEEAAASAAPGAEGSGNRRLKSVIGTLAEMGRCRKLIEDTQSTQLASPSLFQQVMGPV